MSVTDHASALAAMVTRGKPVPRKKIANNTYLEKGGHTTERGDQILPGEIGVVFHETAVVVYGVNYIRLNTGGWLTMTTRERIESFTPDYMRLFSGTDSRWYLSSGRMVGTERPSAPYRDGMTLHLRLAHTDLTACPGANCAWGQYGENHETREAYLLTSGDVWYDIEDEDAHNAMVRRLVKGYIARLKAGTQGQEDGLGLTFATCVLCTWEDQPPTKSRYARTQVIANIGDKMGDQQHLLDHMLDNVLPAEMELHALREVAGTLEGAERWQMVGHRRDEAVRKFLLQRLLVGAVSTKHGRRPVPAAV